MHPCNLTACQDTEVNIISSVQFSRSVMYDSLRPHESQHTRPPCPSPTRGVHTDSRSLSPWCHPAISSSVVPVSFCPQSLPASESFPMSQLFTWGGQSTGVSALASFLPKKSQGWSPWEWTGWISLQSKGLTVNPNYYFSKMLKISALLFRDFPFRTSDFFSQPYYSVNFLKPWRQKDFCLLLWEQIDPRREEFPCSYHQVVKP